MSQQITEVDFNVDDRVLVLLVDCSTGREWLEQGRVGGICGDYLVVELVEREKSPMMPLHKRYAMHVCRDCGREGVTEKDTQCFICWDDFAEAEQWFRSTTPVYRFRYDNLYLTTERPLRRHLGFTLVDSFVGGVA